VILESAVRWFTILTLAFGIMACASPPPTPDLLAPTEEQTKLRNMQTRSFDVTDRNQAMRGVIAALQLVTAARFAEPNYYDVMGVTVTVRPQAGGKMLIRANAIYNNEPITDPKVYQNFFATLERSMFIGRN
jgi:hypothetical protein